MWHMFALGALFLTCGCGGAATANPEQEVTSSGNSQQPAGALSTKVADAVGAWTKCRYSVLLPLTQTTRDAVDIVDESFTQCAPYEASTLQEWTVVHPQTAKADILELRSRMRETALRKVSELRAGSQVAGEPGAWGRCVGEALPPTVERRASAEAIVETALNTCSGVMEVERAGLAEKVGAVSALEQINQMRGYIRSVALDMLEKRRKH